MLPWTARPAGFGASTVGYAEEILGNIPGIHALVQGRTIVASGPLVVSQRARSELPSRLVLNTLVGVGTACVVGLASLAVRHRRSPREGEVVFWALRPGSGLGEAGSILSVFANQLHDGALQASF